MFYHLGGSCFEACTCGAEPAGFALKAGVGADVACGADCSGCQEPTKVVFNNKIVYNLLV